MKNAHTSRSIAQNVILDWTRKLRNNFFRRLTELRKFPMRCSEKNATIFRTISFNCDVSITDIITSNGQNLITNELQEMYVSHGFHHLALNRFHSFATHHSLQPMFNMARLSKRNERGHIKRLSICALLSYHNDLNTSYSLNIKSN